MEIRWANIFALILLVIAGVLLIKNANEISGFLMAMKDIGPGHTTEEKTIGLVAFALVGVLIIAMVKILAQHSSDGKDK